MTIWDAYPSSYRSTEVQALLGALQAGECAAILGLSGSGKSNLAGFMAQRAAPPGRLALLDCNRMEDASPQAFYALALRALDCPPGGLAELEAALETRLAQGPLGLLMDRFDALSPAAAPILHGNLRALRDRHKYSLSYVIVSRRPPEPSSELAELFYGCTLWLGPLSPGDARWSAAQFAARRSLAWEEAVFERLIVLSSGYPSFLRACCEAFAGGSALELEALLASLPVRRRLDEFWADHPSPELLARCGLARCPLLAHPPFEAPPSASLTAAELRLLEYLQSRPGQVCTKDELARAVWPEDRVYEKGIRDDSLAQLVRRLREKVEPAPSDPKFILTVPGRGYKYRQ